MNKNSSANIFIFNFLFSNENSMIKSFLKDYDAYALFNYTNVKEIIPQIINYIKTTKYTSVTIFLIANIMNYNENIFDHNNDNIPIEKIIKLLNQSSFNILNKLVKYNKKVIFKSIQKDDIQEKETERNGDKIILDSKTELVDEFIKQFPKNKKKNNNNNPFKATLSFK